MMTWRPSENWVRLSLRQEGDSNLGGRIRYCRSAARRQAFRFGQNNVQASAIMPGQWIQEGG